jgi:hypothetical protein
MFRDGAVGTREHSIMHAYFDLLLKPMFVSAKRRENLIGC